MSKIFVLAFGLRLTICSPTLSHRSH